MVYFFLRVLSLLSHKSIFTLFVSWLNYVCHKVCFIFLGIRLSIFVRMNILSIFRLHFVWIIFFGFCFGFFVLFCLCVCLGFFVFWGVLEFFLALVKLHWETEKHIVTMALIWQITERAFIHVQKIHHWIG